MKVRLTHKFADRINGVDLTRAREGETLDLSAYEANILMVEGWAEYERGPTERDKAYERPRRKRTRPSSIKRRRSKKR